MYPCAIPISTSLGIINQSFRYIAAFVLCPIMRQIVFPYILVWQFNQPFISKYINLSQFSCWSRLKLHLKRTQLSNVFFIFIYKWVFLTNYATFLGFFLGNPMNQINVYLDFWMTVQNSFIQYGQNNHTRTRTHKRTHTHAQGLVRHYTCLSKKSRHSGFSPLKKRPEFEFTVRDYLCLCLIIHN